MLTAEATLPGLTRSVPTARRFVESALESWDSPDLGWTAALIISELATNCTLHAAGAPFTVRVTQRAEGGVRLEVSDASTALPRQRHHSTTSTTGRGLHIVAGLASAWGVDVVPIGKTIWVELDAVDPRGRWAADDDAAHDDDLDGLLAALGGTDSPTVRACHGPVLQAA